MFKQRKGITPVIAIVLLLLVTVGAVGTVYTQFRDLAGNTADTGFLDSIDVNLQSATRNTSGSNDTIQIRMENTMDKQYILNESLRVEYSTTGESRVEAPENRELFGEYSVDSTAMTCLEGVSTDSAGDPKFFSPGETISCNTGVQMPQPTDEITVHLVEVGSGEVADEYTCSPSSTDSTTC